MHGLTRLIAAALMGAFASTSAAQGAETTDDFEMIRPAAETSLEDWLWIKRPVVVFADSPADPRYVEQINLITERLDALEERDVVVITDTDPGARSSVRQKLRPRGFMLAILAKDGSIVTRKPGPWSVREISRSIDKLPLRQQEARDR
ncbi:MULTISPECIES: DUF4174 domain-containing protein [Mameliella]|uniref:DUF4174 domain-containing protein n=1 Tax=Mameliella TaxID=1434019 RepID=UPI0009F42E2E|nr:MULTISPECIES: DUF4174 domain-containing protein [Mameliella]MCR9273671.1 DUF4174 domain-containing protein [Paracoccaceae bacterium]OWV47484.1 hypothetical protein CDZ96_13485 [Mameliella alba]OWV56798.1 hypothetical protein CDZ98_17430 [Mameliella alba]GGF58554.1 hypothetical protein GCM10011319_19740 [Mameliella alba]